VSDCKRHSGHRLHGRYRHPVGWYKTLNALKGFQGHGTVGTLYSEAQINAIRHAERQEMTNLVGGMTGNEEDADLTDEMEALTRGVHFGGTSTLGPNPPPAPPITGNRPDGRLTSESLCATLEVATHRPREAGPSPPSVWYGLSDEVGDRLVLGNHDQVKEFVASGRFRVASLFGSLPEAQAWMTQDHPDKADRPGKLPRQTTKRAKEVVVIPDSDSSRKDSEATSSSGESSPPPSKKITSKKKNRKARERKASPKKAPGKPKKKEKHRHKPRRGDNYPSSSSSNGHSSDSSLDSDSESLDAPRPPTRRATKRVNERKAKRQTEFRGSDPSIGDKKRIFGIAVNRNEIDAAAGPPDMRTRDSGEIFDTAVGVTSLPGIFSDGFNGCDESYDEAQRTTAMAAFYFLRLLARRPNCMTHYGRHQRDMHLTR
jgi:hypothetical protein